MEYEVSFSASDGFVEITVYEPITTEIQRAFAAEAIEAAKEAGVTRYLADVTRVPNTSGTYDQYSLAYDEMPPMGIARSSKIALLIRQGDLSHDFIEILFLNNGYDCRKFFSKDEAVAWLKG